MKATGVVALGRDLVVGSLVVGAVLAAVFGTATFLAARRWLSASFEERLREATARRYLETGIFHWEFVRGKLRYDPMYRAFSTSTSLPREGCLVDVGCGRGILLALLATARELGKSLSPPASWEPPSDRLELVGVELRPKLAEVACEALGDSARIESGDAAAFELPTARAILLLDVLHYLPAPDQERLLQNAAGALEPRGVLLVREADADSGWRFFLTRTAERLCALARGHWRQHFHYRGADEWCELLRNYGLKVGTRPMSAGTPYANRLIEARRSRAQSEDEAAR